MEWKKIRVVLLETVEEVPEVVSSKLALLSSFGVDIKKILIVVKVMSDKF